MSVTFITGNKIKADHLARYLDYPVNHQSVDLEEIQSLDPDEIVTHKVRQAYDLVKKPVLVEDVSVTIHALGRLPGPFIKWFEQELGLEGIIKLVDNYDDRSASAKVTYGYYDGRVLKLFRGEVKGEITKELHMGPHDFGWNPIFRPEGWEKTYAELTEKEVETMGLRPSTVYPEIKRFMSALDSH